MSMLEMYFNLQVLFNAPIHKSVWYGSSSEEAIGTCPYSLLTDIPLQKDSYSYMWLMVIQLHVHAGEFYLLQRPQRGKLNVK